MKVKRTYGRRKTEIVEDSRGDDTFDQLFQNEENNDGGNPGVKQVIDATFNRDSSLDESKIVKLKNKRKPSVKTKKRVKSLLESSHDEFYELYLKDKKKKQVLKKSRLDTLRNVQNSTPLQRKRKKVESLAFGISPIRLDDSDQKSLESSDINAQLIESMKRQRLREIQQTAKDLESSAVKKGKELLERMRLKRAAGPAIATVTVKEPEHEEIQEDQDALSYKEQSLEVPLIEVTPPVDEDSSKEENSLALPPKLIASPAQVEDDIVPPMKRVRITQTSTRTSKRKTSKASSIFHVEGVGASPVIKELAKQIARKSVAFNLVPAIKEVARVSTRASTAVVPSQKKSLRFVEDVPESPLKVVALRPGKWRKSLIAWRASENNRKSSRLTTVILEESLPAVKRYSEKLLETLGESVLLEQSDEGNLHAALSILDASIKCATTFHDQRKTSQRKTSVFQRSSIFYGLQTPLIDVAPSLSARQIALRRCGQQEPLPFNETYSESQLPNCCKIGEGVYGEVFMYKCPTTHQPIVLKIIPIEGSLLVNGEPQKRFDEILQEIVISMELSGLRNDKEYSTDGFVNVKRVTCVQGAYPEHLIDEWELYRDNRFEGSDNDHPEVFGYNQLYVVFELCNGGKDLEAFVFNNAEEAQSIFLQIALTLAVAEKKFEFEHRDLHWGNILIAPTTEKFVEFRFDGKVIKLLTHGVKATIIDYSLSRMVYDGAVLYDNLARDEELFQSTGDYQFDIYRLMRERVENNFERYEPYTNLLWLHYMVDKLINGARYRYSKTKKHRAAVNEMMQERDELLNFSSASDYVTTLDV